MKKDLLLVTISELLFQTAENSVVVFGIIFFYTRSGGSILLATLPFVLRHIVHAFLLPILSPILFKIGFKRSIMLGSLFYALSCIVIFLNNDNLNLLALFLWAVIAALGNVFHYVPIIYILGYETKHGSRGKVFSLRRIIFIIGTIVTPILGGLISQYFGITGLMIICIGFYILTTIPIVYVSAIEFIGGKPVLKTLATKRGKNILLFKISQVFSDVMGFFWPILVFLMLTSSYENVGVVFAIVSFGSILISYLIGFELDHLNRMKLYKWASFTNFFTWVARATAFDYISILLSDIVYRLNVDFKGSIIDVIDYDLMNDHIQKNRAGAIILSETIINYAIAFTMLLGAVLISIFGFQASFIAIAVIGFILAQLTRKYLKRG